MDAAQIAAMIADREAGTPDLGGWAWFGARDDLYLATKRGGRRFVMNFVRKGMHGAQPRFCLGGIMYPAIDDLAEYAVGERSVRGQRQAIKDSSVYRLDISGIDHPDARRMTRIPDMETHIIAQAAELERMRSSLTKLRDLMCEAFEDDDGNSGCGLCENDCTGCIADRALKGGTQ